MDDLLVVGLRLAFLALLYGFLLAVMRALRADVERPAPASGARAVARLPAPAERHSSLAALVPLDGLSRAGGTIELADDNLIGREPDCTVVLEDSSVSGRHARLRRQDEAWTVADLQSTNGTRVNDRAVRGEVPVRSGDLLSFGLARFKLVERP